MDTAAICFLLIGTMLLVRAITLQHQKAICLVSAGLSVGIASIYHPASFTWFLSLVVAVAVCDKPRLRSVLTFCIGSALPVLSWLAFAAQRLSEFEAQFVVQVTNRTSDGNTLERVYLEILRYGRELERFPTIFLIGLAAVFGLRNRNISKDPRLKFIAVLTIALIAMNALIAGKGSGFYTLYPMTLILSWIAMGAFWFIDDNNRRGRAKVIAVTLTFGLFLVNSFVFSYGSRLLAWSYQVEERDYYKQFSKFSQKLKPGDEVWGSAVAWYAVVNASARIDAMPESVPVRWNTHPDPSRHRFAVFRPGTVSAKELVGFHKVLEFGNELPTILGSPLSDAPYKFELWESTLMSRSQK
jgi:hypothetical protein